MVARALLARGIDAYLGPTWRSLKRNVHASRRRGPRRFDVFIRLEDGHSLLLAQALPAIASAAGAEVRRWLIPPPPLEVEPEPHKRRAWAIQDAALLAKAHPELTFPDDAVVPDDDAIAAAERQLAARGWQAYVDIAHDLLSGQSMHGPGEQPRVTALHHRGAAELAARGHYQPGMLHYEGEWYWGLDRLWHLCERLADENVDVTAPEPLPPKPAEGPLVAYFSFRSPYSYVALARLAQREVDLRPVLPMVMRGYRVPRTKRLYIARDAAREARRWGVPFGRLVDPLGPGIDRCIATFFHQPNDKRLAVSQSIMRGIWAEGVDVGRGPGLAELVTRAGGTWEEPDVAAGAAWRATVAQHRDALAELGLWGVPSFSRGALRVWGQDRLPWL